MKINVHIERMVVDDLGVQPQQAEELKAAVVAALRQQLVAQGVGSTMLPETNLLSVRGGSVSIENINTSSSLGRQIGNAVYRGVGQ